MKFNSLQSASGVLLTDQYQFTMAQLYYRMGIHETNAQFDHFYRSNPNYGIHKAGYCVYAGLESLMIGSRTSCFWPKRSITYAVNGRQPENNSSGTTFSNGSKRNFQPRRSISMLFQRAGSFIQTSLYTWLKRPLAVSRILETGCRTVNYQILIATKSADQTKRTGDKY